MDEAGPNPFWDYAVALYGQPGVAEACLELQDRHGLDVNLVLYCVWAAARGPGRLATAELERLDALLAPWRDEVILPLRGVRRRLKAAFPGYPDGPRERLRSSVQSLEIAAERVAQDRLHAEAAGLARPDGVDAPAMAARNLMALVAVAGIEPAEAAEPLRRVLAAAFPVGPVSPPAAGP